ncbi:phytoene/squalene synthase family protein [Jatrophihabitans telluris]|uniref:Phytoene/squalene synthase family protein n=1 Tax=Jatrophihabitans telluris TaxID=2038343 RepID=A0ABY4QSY5_9ACTN|nr:phytoene/squalene synthase family protein [Jatrophihabitans telluris]UQX86854.1 phytoene/squalene synthase family protein [Jatrophihabitans telluris]
MSRQSEAELDAAGIHGQALRNHYTACRTLNARHGKTYYLATLLLPAAKRPAVHALYGFARWVDDVIDATDSPLTLRAQADILDAIEGIFRTSSRGGAGGPASPPAQGLAEAPPMLAVRDAMQRWDIPAAYFLAFLDSMRMDLTVTEYETYADLERYMWGSAAVIGLQMLPVLGLAAPVEVAAPYAVDLGVAFQLTNFLRDLGEDLRRGRIYLPLESLRRHGVDRDRLLRGVVDGPIRRLLADEIARTRELYRTASHGVRLLDPTSRACVQTALTLYRGILDDIERRDYRILHERAGVSIPRRARVAVPGLLAARRDRFRSGRTSASADGLPGRASHPGPYEHPSETS